MKAFTQFAVMASLVLSLTSIAHAWDVYIYNKTKKALLVQIQETNWGRKQLFCEFLLYSGKNHKCTTGFFGMNCPTKAYVGEWRYTVPIDVVNSGVDNKCTNTRLEITYDEQEKKYRAIWYTQW